MEQTNSSLAVKLFYTMSDTIILLLEKLGFSSYEAKAYLGLLQNNPVTGYQLSKNTGIPRSRVYETLERLVKKGGAIILDSQPAKYSPVEYKNLLDRLSTEFNDSIKNLNSSLAQINSTNTAVGIWNITGRENIIEKAKNMIQGAEKSIYLCCWAGEAEILREELIQAETRSLSVVIISCGVPSFRTSNFFIHSFERECCYAKDIALITDSKEVLLGAVSPDDSCQCAWSQNMGIASIAEEYIRHEVYINIILKIVSPKVKKQMKMAFEEACTLISVGGKKC